MYDKNTASLEMPGIEPGASHMRSERSTTELHPHLEFKENLLIMLCRSLNDNNYHS